MSLTKQQAHTLAGNDFKLVDKEGREWIASAVFSDDRIGLDTTNPEPEGLERHTTVKFSEIGTDFWVLKRDFSMLTKSITVEGETIVPIVELAKIADLDFTNKGLILRDRDGLYGCYYIDRTELGTVFNFSKNNKSFALYTQEPKIIHLVPRQEQLFQKLYSLHFFPSLPKELTRNIES